MQRLRTLLVPAIPFLFIFFWSTGFITAKYALPYAEPFHILLIRMLLNLVVFAALIIWLKRKMLTWQQASHQMIVGLLVHALYLGGVFAAMNWGLSAGMSALIVGLQPLLTAVLAWQLFSQHLYFKQWLGLLLGLSGVVLVLYGNGRLEETIIALEGWVAIVIALIAISSGTIYQKHFGQGVDPITGSFFQYLSTAVFIAWVSFQFETGVIDWQWPLILSIAWMVIGLSVIAILLLLYMIQENESARVASYFYLVPPTTAFEAWLLFDEKFSFIALIGVLITVIGVYWVTHQKAQQ